MWRLVGSWLLCCWLWSTPAVAAPPTVLRCPFQVCLQRALQRSPLIHAAVLGVDACPMEGIEPAKYDEILGLTGTGYATVVACPLGYRAADDKYATTRKVRFKADDVIIRR